MTGNGWVAVCAQVCFVAAVGAQTPPDTSRYTESVRTAVISHSGSTTRERRIVRDARYTVIDSSGMMVVRADTIALTEVAAGVARQIDVDAVIGGRWVMQEKGGAWRSIDRPFVPEEVADVSDVGRAFDDFWPGTPPPLRVGAQQHVGAIEWERLADSGGSMRYTWITRQVVDTVRLVADSVPLSINEVRRESGSGAWRPGASRPFAWRRDVRTTVESEVRRRVVRSEVEQTIVVRRDP